MSKDADGEAGCGYLTIIVFWCIVWFWWIGGCSYIKDVINEHKVSRASQTTGQTQPERPTGE